ncbi:hypothetical protein PanWU01x14_302120, partial [Parasponia andersonii]
MEFQVRSEYSMRPFGTESSKFQINEKAKETLPTPLEQITPNLLVDSSNTFGADHSRGLVRES